MNMKRAYNIPHTECHGCQLVQVLCASGRRQQSLTTGGTANPSGGR